MTRLSINLPDEITKKLAARAEESGHPNVEQYVEEVLRTEAEAHDLRAPQQVTFKTEGELLEQLRVGRDSGPAREITDEQWDEKRRALIQKHSEQNGK